MKKQFSLTTFMNALFAANFNTTPARSGYVPFYIGNQWPAKLLELTYKVGSPGHYEQMQDKFGEPWCLVPLGAIEKVSYRPNNGAFVLIEGDGETFVVEFAHNLDSLTCRALQKAGYRYVGTRQPFTTLWCVHTHHFEVDGLSAELTQQYPCPDCLTEYGQSENFAAGNFSEAILLTKMLYYFKNIGQKFPPIKVLYSEMSYTLITASGRQLRGPKLVELFERLSLPVADLRAYSIGQLVENAPPHLGVIPLPTVLPASLGVSGEWWNNKAYADFLS